MSADREDGKAAIDVWFHRPPACDQSFPYIQNEDIVLRNVLMRHFPEMYEEKRLQVEEEALLKMR